MQPHITSLDASEERSLLESSTGDCLARNLVRSRSVFVARTSYLQGSSYEPVGSLVGSSLAQAYSGMSEVKGARARLRGRGFPAPLRAPKRRRVRQVSRASSRSPTSQTDHCAMKSMIHQWHHCAKGHPRKRATEGKMAVVMYPLYAAWPP